MDVQKVSNIVTCSRGGGTYASIIGPGCRKTGTYKDVLPSPTTLLLPTSSLLLLFTPPPACLPSSLLPPPPSSLSSHLHPPSSLILYYRCRMLQECDI